MRIKTLVGLASLAVGGLGTIAGASAADLPSYAPAPAPYIAPVPVFTWTGFYLGVNAGAAWNSNKTSYNYTTFDGGANDFTDAFGSVSNAEALGIIPASLGSDSNTGFTGGGQIGFNWQAGAIVWGLEADIDGMSNGHHGGSLNTTVPGFTNSVSATSKLDYLGTVRGRVGFAMFDRALLYATGGLAYGQTSSSTSSIGSDGRNFDTFAGSSSKMRVGYTVGGGVEYAFTNNWTMKVEGLYYDLGSSSYNVLPQNANSTTDGISIRAHNHYQGEMVRVGLNYKF